ncbi:protein-export chaperone SecB [Winogradskya humida]|uniref:Uncharacterized protein n=1 Tax=Winogradskya humida TaxID=113566 RepID=A0ABQ3ZU82_9ACTN|nr:protein-export chaperone SecB [Actinoplanes humidus]GIE22136.1 hypothetical protein Ahu01nite_052380 [Actinoplanes humidus]
MKAQQAVDGDRATSNAISNNFKLIDLRLKNVAANLMLPSPRKPLDLAASVLVDISRLGEFVTYDARYKLGVTDRDGRQVLEADIIYSLLFRLRDGWSPAEDELRSFGTYGAVDIAHPYMREIVQTITGRMGLPPLVLDIRAPEPTE